METDVGSADAADVAPRAIVADDDALARRLTRDTLRRGGITVVAQATTGREALELALFYRPDVVVMDDVMPGMDGIEATERLHARDPSISVVVLAACHDDEVGLRALRAGAVGFLAKDIELDALPRVLFGARAGEAAISRRFARTLIERYRASSVDGAGLRPVRSCLSTREWEVLDLLTEDLTLDQIAAVLVISTETVRSHVKNVYRKLGVHSRRDARRAADRLRGLAVSAADGSSHEQHRMRFPVRRAGTGRCASAGAR